MTAYEPFVGYRAYAGEGPPTSGHSVADLLMESGRAQADSYNRQGEIWRQGIGAATGAITAGLDQYGKQENDKRVAQAVQQATAPPKAQAGPMPDGSAMEPKAPDVNQILSSLPPDLRERATKGIQDFQEYATKSQQAQAEVAKLHQDLLDKQREAQQHAVDAVAVGAHHALDFSDQPDGGLSADTLLFHQARAAGLDTSQFEPFLAAAHQDFAKVQGDPAGMAAFQKHYQAQRQPILQNLTLGASPSVAEKFDAKTREVKTLNADGSETTKIVEDKPGFSATGAPKPDTRSLEIQRADALAKGDTKKAASLLSQMSQEAAAKRDPGADAAPTLTGPALDMVAHQFAQTGQLPPMGMGRSGATVRQAIINRAAELHPDANIAANKAGFGADSASIKKLQQQTDAVSAFEQTATKNAKLLDGILEKLPDTGTSLLNKPLRAAESALGSEKMATFNTLRQSVQNEYARIISNPGLSGTMSDSARKEAETLLNPDATVGQIRAALKALQAEAENRRTSYQDQLDQINKRMSGGGAKPIPPGAKPGGAAQFRYDPATGQLVKN